MSNVYVYDEWLIIFPRKPDNNIIIGEAFQSQVATCCLGQLLLDLVQCMYKINFGLDCNLDNNLIYLHFFIYLTITCKLCQFILGILLHFHAFIGDLSQGR